MYSNNLNELISFCFVKKKDTNHFILRDTNKLVLNRSLAYYPDFFLLEHIVL